MIYNDFYRLRSIICVFIEKKANIAHIIAINTVKAVILSARMISEPKLGEHLEHLFRIFRGDRDENIQITQRIPRPLST